jgi:hypothetical protein
MNGLRAAACAALMVTAPGAVWGFEGTLKLRTVSVERDQLSKITGGKAPDAEQTLALSADKLLAAKDAGAQMRESMMYVSGNKVRMDTPLDKSKDGYAIIDTDKNTTWFVVPGEKRYIEWSEADAKAMGEKMAQVEKMLKERMGSLPPEQRTQVEAMLKNMKGAEDGQAAKVDIKPTGKTQTVNGMQAAAYEVKTGDETMVGWVTQDQPELSKMLRTVQERMEKMTPASMRGRQSARTSLSEKGFPVMVQTLDPGHYRVEEVTAVEKKPVSADLFVVPKDFAKTTGRDAMNAIPDKGEKAEKP